MSARDDRGRFAGRGPTRPVADVIEEVEFLQGMGYTTVIQLAQCLGMHPTTLDVTLYRARARGLYAGPIDATGLRARVGRTS